MLNFAEKILAMLQFNFKKPLQEVLSRLLLRTFPGIDKVWLIAEDGESENFNLFEANQQNHRAQLVNKVQVKKNNYLNSKNFYRWTSLNETPLTADKEAQKQFNIFDEYKNRILHLYIPPVDDQFIVLYIFFNEQQALTGARADSRLSTEHKELVAHTIYHLLNYECERYSSDNRVAAHISNMQQRMSTARQSTGQEDFMEAYIEEYLVQAGQKLGYTIQISKDALHYLTNQQVSPSGLKQILEEAIAWLSNFGTDEDILTIEEAHVIKPAQTTSPMQGDHDHRHDGKYNRTFDLLEKLETAGQRVVQNGQRLTGVNVGLAWEPSISAPAITDALRKHRQKIQTLARLYPDRWQVMRTQFKPLQNVLESNDETLPGEMQSA